MKTTTMMMSFFDMFDELNALKQAEEARKQGELMRNPQPEGGDSYKRAQAELTLYRGEPMMALLKETEHTMILLLGGIGRLSSSPC
jgi:hypothetical protein